LAKISVLVPTWNNGSTLAAALESVRWADELVIIDSFSTDSTLAVARRYGARILQHEYINSARQKNEAIPQCAHEWVLQLDSDETLELGAEEEIRAKIADTTQDTHAFCLRRKNFVWGEWVKVANLYPDFQTRFFQRDLGRFEDKEVHARIVVPGRTDVLEHHILHQGMTCISKQLGNLDRYARYQAQEMFKRRKRFAWHQLGLRPLAAFGYYFFLKRGFQAGARGFAVAALDASFVFWSYAKLWELEQRGSS
jgi:glycosyltransferase involved in cell wall biosynthesis